jgi:cell division protein FtsL
MTRLNIILFLVLIATALGAVTSQHKARKLYIELQQQQLAAKQYAIEYGQLKLEQSTWAMHSRIEQIAEKKLQMQVPDDKRVQVVTPGASVGADEAIKNNSTEPHQSEAGNSTP